jgi:uncharacterized membrane protein required for colicin V production
LGGQKFSLVFPLPRFNVETMFAVELTKSFLSGVNLPFNWFDITLLAILIFGLWRGRRNGMSREFIPTTQWILIVAGGGLASIPAAHYLTQWGVTGQLMGLVKAVFEKQATERGVGLVCSYLFIAMVITILVSIIKRKLKTKIEGSNAFGNSEYYLGMISGMIRFACITIFALALLNGPHYSQAEATARVAADRKTFGADLYAGSYFPHIFNVQEEVFKKSLTGPYIKTGLSAILLEDGFGEPAKKTDKP